MRRVILVVSLMLLAGVAFLYRGLPGYMIAAGEYRRLVDQRPKSRAEVERILKASPRRIEKADSAWGRHTGLEGDFIQYSYLGAAIDVVYDRDGRVLAILSSYE